MVVLSVGALADLQVIYLKCFHNTFINTFINTAEFGVTFFTCFKVNVSIIEIGNSKFDVIFGLGNVVSISGHVPFIRFRIIFTGYKCLIFLFVCFI